LQIENQVNFLYDKTVQMVIQWFKAPQRAAEYGNAGFILKGKTFQEK
jgi:hypothetical protein